MPSDSAIPSSPPNPDVADETTQPAFYLLEASEGGLSPKPQKIDPPSENSASANSASKEPALKEPIAKVTVTEAPTPRAATTDSYERLRPDGATDRVHDGVTFSVVLVKNTDELFGEGLVEVVNNSVRAKEGYGEITQKTIEDCIGETSSLEEAFTNLVRLQGERYLNAHGRPGEVAESSKRSRDTSSPESTTAEDRSKRSKHEDDRD